MGALNQGAAVQLQSLLQRDSAFDLLSNYFQAICDDGNICRPPGMATLPRRL
jgi:hypothetical protein